MMTMFELKPCPFCGSEKCATRIHKNVYGDIWWEARCNNCGAELSNKLFDTDEDAARAWNRRADDGI